MMRPAHSCLPCGFAVLLQPIATFMWVSYREKPKLMFAHSELQLTPHAGRRWTDRLKSGYAYGVCSTLSESMNKSQESDHDTR
jgi:hypothetical protein